MGFGVAIQVEGEYALFSRPDLKTERFSYSVITPSAARGIVEAVYWKPQIDYAIKQIYVYHEPEYTNIRRNEVSKKASAAEAKSLMHKKALGKGFIDTTQCIQQRASTLLKNVKYVISAEFKMTGVDREEGDTEAKHYNVLLRRLRKGQCFHQPYLGTREFPAKITLIEGEIPESGLKGERDFGIMLYDMDYSDPVHLRPEFFHCTMRDGVIDLSHVRKMR